MGPEGAVNIIYRRDLAQSPTPDERRGKLMDDYKARFANPYSAAERGYIDDVILPHETRPRLITELETLHDQARARPQAQARQHPAVGRRSPVRAPGRSRRRPVRPVELELEALALAERALEGGLLPEGGDVDRVQAGLEPGGEPLRVGERTLEGRDLVEAADRIGTGRHVHHIDGMPAVLQPRNVRSAIRRLAARRFHRTGTS